MSTSWERYQKIKDENKKNRRVPPLSSRERRALSRVRSAHPEAPKRLQQNTPGQNRADFARWLFVQGKLSEEI